jgi:hypothetical protein
MGERRSEADLGERGDLLVSVAVKVLLGVLNVGV